MLKAFINKKKTTTQKLIENAIDWIFYNNQLKEINTA